MERMKSKVIKGITFEELPESALKRLTVEECIKYKYFYYVNNHWFGMNRR